MAFKIQKSVAPGNETSKAHVCIPVAYVVFFALFFVATIVVACLLFYKLRKLKNPNHETRMGLTAATLSSHMENSATDPPELSYESLTFVTDTRRPRGIPTPAADDSNDNESIYSSVDSYASINELNNGMLLRGGSTNDEEPYSELTSPWDASDPTRPDIPPPPPSPPPKCPPRALKPLKAKFSEPLPLPPNELPTVFDLDAASSVERKGGTLRHALRTHRIFRSRLIDSLESLVD